MKKVIIIITAILCSALFVQASELHGTLIVTIESEEGQALPGATVMLFYGYQYIRTEQTGPNGKITFRNLPFGYYRIDVLMDSFDPNSLEILMFEKNIKRISISLPYGDVSEYP